MTESFEGYRLESRERLLPNGRWSVEVKVSLQSEEQAGSRTFREEKISLILPEEAAKEGINLGKNMIKRNMVGF